MEETFDECKRCGENAKLKESKYGWLCKACFAEEIRSKKK